MERHTPESAPLRVAVIVGSTREGRRGREVADWYVGLLEGAPGIDVDVIDLVDHQLPERHTFAADAAVTGFCADIDRADAFVVVTPEYNHSYPAALKHAIDYGKDQWKRKPVAFVSYGGVSGGLRAVEHLRQVFAELHAVGIRDTVSFHGPFNGFGDRGPSDPVGAELAVRAQLEDLRWWATTLRTGRVAALQEAW